MIFLSKCLQIFCLARPLLVVVQLAEDVLLLDEAGGVAVQEGVADTAPVDSNIRYHVADSF